jgi:class 3 adenylate cyclase
MIEERILRIEGRIDMGRVFEACDLASEGLETYKDDSRLNQLYGLCLARLGQTEKARKLLESMYLRGDRDEETIGILARIYKDIFKKSGDLSFGEKSRDIYLSGYRNHGSSYNGINAATMSLITGDRDQALAISEELLQYFSARNDHSFWDLATMGEACLLSGRSDDAFTSYKNAQDAGKGKTGYLSSAYNQLLFLSRYIDVDTEVISMMKPLPVVFFSGHMIDEPNREVERFPDSISDLVARDIGRAIDEINPAMAYVSAACGADILFIEEMLKRDRDVTLFLPFAKNDFITTSVVHAGDHWVERFNNVTEHCRTRYVTEEEYMGDDFLFHFLGQVMMGHTILHSRVNNSEPWFLGVLDSESQTVMGGTADMAKRWPVKDNVTILDPGLYLSGTHRKKRGEGRERVLPRRNLNRQMRYILFADIVGYSKMAEGDTPVFIYDVMERAAKGLADLVQPERINTWGDAIYAVFQQSIDAMKYASTLRDLMDNSIIKDNRLPDSLSVRIALHAGPVFLGDDPLTGRKNAWGSHVNRTARIEPVTIPGGIYASDQFAATLVSALSGVSPEAIDRYLYTYVGRIELPKGFGSQEIYLLENMPHSS